MHTIIPSLHTYSYLIHSTYYEKQKQLFIIRFAAQKHMPFIRTKNSSDKLYYEKQKRLFIIRFAAQKHVPFIRRETIF
ncbi:hypothetical protein D7V86_14160 [bacterium D16-51]|nr:hypothetical protein D7V96_23665 [bacterium D16-59]RKI58983.1 hypothetical protein D7V86_14160 [bacterium D16-51]